MTFTASQYLFKGTNHTSTTTATVGGYVVPAATRGEVMALTLANSSSGNLMNYADVSIYDGATVFPVAVKAPVYPGGNLTVYAVAKQVLPTGGAVYITPYATAGVLTSIMTVIEVT